ncbi:PDZ domain-containing protein [Thermococcus sp.]|uniref:PDZ domain-containing protein n=1 Tax=Thermococcus sp. TaxID=35749 RepID=UPI00262E5DF3|nr:PDZ domain-containing protein [Thermococcus sp.]
MNDNSKLRTLLHLFFPLFLIAAFIKLAWVFIELFLLPIHGVRHERATSPKLLPHRFRLASDEALPKALAKKPSQSLASIRDLKLVATYQGPSQSLAVIEKGSRAKVLGLGDSLAGYRLEQVLSNAVIMRRNGREYRLEIKQKALKGYQQVPLVSKKNTANENDKISHEGTATVVPRSLIEKYTKNVDKIWKDIGIVPEKRGGSIQGFRIRYIRRGSVFDKLGLKRGDLITAVNGERLNDYGTVMELFQSIDDLEGLTLNIKRGKKEVELDYDIQ